MQKLGLAMGAPVGKLVGYSHEYQPEGTPATASA